MSNKWLVYNCLSLVVLYYLAHCLLEQLFAAQYNYIYSEFSDDRRGEMYYPRGSLARTLYNKQLFDASLETMDQSQVSESVCSFSLLFFDLLSQRLYHFSYTGCLNCQVIRDLFDFFFHYVIIVLPY